MYHLRKRSNSREQYHVVQSVRDYQTYSSNRSDNIPRDGAPEEDRPDADSSCDPDADFPDAGGNRPDTSGHPRADPFCGVPNASGAYTGYTDCGSANANIPDIIITDHSATHRGVVWRHNSHEHSGSGGSVAHYARTGLYDRSTTGGGTRRRVPTVADRGNCRGGAGRGWPGLRRLENAAATVAGNPLTVQAAFASAFGG